jgi:hypothetical protein
VVPDILARLWLIDRDSPTAIRGIPTWSSGYLPICGEMKLVYTINQSPLARETLWKLRRMVQEFGGE